MEADFINLTSDNINDNIYAASFVAKLFIRGLKQNDNGLKTE